MPRIVINYLDNQIRGETERRTFTGVAAAAIATAGDDPSTDRRVAPGAGEDDPCRPLALEPPRNTIGLCDRAAGDRALIELPSSPSPKTGATEQRCSDTFARIKCSSFGFSG